MTKSIRNENPIIGLVNGMLIDLPSPSNLSYFWNFGSLLGLCLVVQIITGIFLAMHYCPDVNLAFSSVEHITRDVNLGFILRYIHANGASVFFLFVYLHIGRGLFYGGFRKLLPWNVGVVIFLIMILTSFLGYVLPWGQMSFWAVTVITNLLSAVPYIGEDLVRWVWGGFSVSNATLHRFFSFHYLFPFLLVGLALVHMIGLHEEGSDNPTGLKSEVDKVAFHYSYSLKDLYGFLVYALILSILAFLFPYTLGDAENYKEANPLVTPVHIKPEWYFLFAYAILRSVPNKLGGVVALVSSIVVLFILPYLARFRSFGFWRLGEIFFWFLVGDFILLTWLGGLPPEEPYLFVSQISSVFYFVYFLILLPLEAYMGRWALKDGRKII
uniref:Cytochrome b n=1 Tax=Suberites domuncula TaxID=55567 RepID=B1GT50_SUBDO|nr:cytochrome b [Suberites domuncula]CAM84210.1 cytochrome b [Suberites domuncula]